MGRGRPGAGVSELLFWCSVAFIAYSYLGFPALAVLRGWLWRRPYTRADITPDVSLIIVAHNEARGIAARLDNLLTLDYPREQLEIIVASDGSADGTESIVAGYAEKGVRLFAYPRIGKISALNAAAAGAQNQILVFTDANSIFTPQALRALVRPYADLTIGGVAGDQRFLRKGQISQEGVGERSYWDYERMLKVAESRAGNTLCASGALYAIRRSLFRPLPPAVTDDFCNSTGVIAQGHRLVFEAEAVAYEQVAPSEVAEFRRKVRVITRGLQGVVVRRELLNPLRYGFYSLQFLSHKVLRRLVFLPLLLLAVLAPVLWNQGVIYRIATIVQALLYAGALLGYLNRHRRAGRNKLVALPFYFVLINLACIIAVTNLVRGRRIDLWEPTHNLAPVPGAPSNPESSR